VINTVSRITAEQIDQANATDRTPVVFIHGLWLLPHSWDRWATVFDQAGYAPQKHNEGVTEIIEIPNRGHALVIDYGWREVADTALAFVKRFVPAVRPA
jgi:pimeloyl-ACP methyl ester carboxylesterase